jgi:type I restriction enzyme, S subunit
MWDKRPSDWEVRRLSEISTRITRRNDGAGHPVMTISAKRGFILQSEKYSRDMAGKSEERYTLIRRGEFAYNKGNSITAPQGCIFRLDQASAVVPFVYYCFSVDRDIDDDYAISALRNGVLNRELSRAINSGVRNDGLLNLPADDFFACQVAIPPLAEQRAIAEVLRAVEGTIAKTEALIEAILDAKHAAMRELLTLGVRRGKAPLKKLPNPWILGRIAEGVTHIPSDWHLVTLSKVAKLESGHTPDRKKPSYWDGEIPWISLQDADALNKLIISESAETIGPEGMANSSARPLPAGTVVFQRTANVGLSAVMGREMCTSQHFANWICGEKLDPFYLQQVFRHMSREWLRLVAGSVLPDIYMDTFKALQILLPPVSEQRKIGEIGAAFDLRIEQERKALASLIENRSALAQELLSGRLRLPDSIIARRREKAGQAA